MNKKNKTFNKLNLWWSDFFILNSYNNIIKFSHINNLFYFKLHENLLFFFFLLNKKNFNTIYFYNLDAVIINKTYYIASSSFFFDLKLLLEVTHTNSLESISKVFYSFTWVERELKEFNNISFYNLKDTRKLLLNYNSNHDLTYNNYNAVINDLNI
jgi:hypothetical protein